MFNHIDEKHNDAIEAAIKKYRGQAYTLESALGAVIIGEKYGWRVLKVIHSPATYRKYEKILGIKFEDICEERSEYTKRSLGLRVADALNSFWAVATGKKKISGKAEFATESEIAKGIANAKEGVRR